MNLTISNRQRHSRPGTVALRRLLRWLMARTNRRQPSDRAWGRITLILTDDRGMRRINSAVFGREVDTDVIACLYTPVPGVETGVDADIVVNVCRAMDRARRGWPPSRELALYLAHGCDHLGGACDDTSAGAARMRRRELRWLRQAAALGLLDGILA